MAAVMDAADAKPRRKIGFWMCTALVVGNVIGMGIFVLPASMAPYGLNALLGWGATLVGCLALARIFAHLAKAMPEADGPYVYMRYAFGEIPAFIALWAYWAAIWPTDAAFVTGVVGYLGAVFPATTAISPVVLALALLWSVVLINLFGVRTGGAVQVVTTVLKLVPMVAVAVLGAWVLIHSPSDYVAHVPTTPISMHAVMGASALALFAMIGIESAAMPAARVDNPGRTIPRATMIGTGLVVLIYLVVSTVPLLLVKQGDLATSSAPLSLLMEQLMGPGYARWLGLFVVISGLGALNGWTLLVGEITRTMAEHGVMPKMLGRSNRFGSPAAALIVIGLCASAMVLMSYSKSLVGAFTFFTRLVTASNLPLYSGCVLAFFILWRRGKVPLRARSVLPVVVIGLLYVVMAFIGAGTEATLLMFALCAAGLPLYAYVKWRAKQER
ncbi:MAG TPA: amino acid permease [Oleiagrimonas sp.]|nr:amino acid permease [Oleiagrimonas sp.]